MSLRQRFREWMLGGDAEGDDVPPSSALLNTLLGREEDRVRSLGEYSATSYPTDLRDLLSRRAEVAQELLGMEITDRSKRVEAIPHIRELLRKYPHPLAYETLIHAYIDAGRFDEAKGVAFAARQRRIECASSEHPEIRAEIESLREWTSKEIDELKEERATPKSPRS
jgi:pentatricopeptide repeat protein